MASAEAQSFQQRVLELLEHALDWPPETRAAQLRVATEGEPELLARLQVLLGFATAQSAVIPEEPHGLFFKPPAIPARIGPYRLTEIVGEGGMGLVCKGERADGLFEQTVAIKLVRPGLLGPALLARFSEERRLLARLTHPNIAQLFDGGTDEAGNAYIVMEFVDGQSITDYLKHLATRVDARAWLHATMALFEQACIAVQAAHQQLIVHADIKPGNVLVTAAGQVKLLDFGIARLLDAQALDLDSPASDIAGDNTSTAQPSAANEPMTRAYASPERRAGMPPDVASDVYALGAMLFELLVGSLPDTVTQTRVLGAADRDVAIPRWRAPSLAIAAPTGGTATSAERQRQAQAVSGDLDAIVLRSIAAAPADRYATVAELLADLHAWRNDRPLLARANAGALYKIGKFLRRNRLATAAASTIFVVLLAATITTQAQYRAAEQARADANRRFDEARAMSKYMLFDLFDRLSPVPGTLAARRDLAQTAQGYLDRLSSIAGASPELRRETAEGYVRLGGIQGGHGRENLGDVVGLRRNFARAEAIYRAAIRNAPARTDVRIGFLSLLTEQAFQAMHADNRLDVAEKILNEADQIARETQRLAPNDKRLADLQWTLQLYRIDLLQWLDRQSEAVALGARAVAQAEQMARQMSPQAQRSPEFSSRTTLTYKRHAESLRYAGRAAEAVPFHERSIRIAMQAISNEPGRVRPLKSASLNEWSYGQSLMEVRAPALALRHFDAAIALNESALRLDHDNDQLLRTDLLNRSDRALALSALGRHREALRAFEQVLATARARVAAQPLDPSRTRDLWEQQRSFGDIALHARMTDTACSTWRTLVPVLVRARQRHALTDYDAEAILGSVQTKLSANCRL